MKKQLHANLRCLFSFNALIRTFTFYTDVSVNLLVFINALIIVWQRQNYSSEEVGISLGFTASLVSTLAWFMKQVVDMGNYMTSAERVL
jgi:hypothetical protein